jgi:N-acetyl sugar amidotransferase
MDTTDREIIFDQNGFCNHCTQTLLNLKSNFGDESSNIRQLDDIILNVRKEGKGKKYDCIIGLSGGIDSSYLAYLLVRQYKIRPLAIHVDNGWNADISVSNIHKIVTRLNIDLITHVINWEEFRELQKSFLFASVVDLEMLSDHAIGVVINKLARKHRIKYFLIGSNYQSESILPKSWFYSDKLDSINIMDIYNKHGSGMKIKTFPFLSFREYFFYGTKYGKYLMPLSFMNYNKEMAKKLLMKELDWQDYGGKHHESFITKFYQTIILPEKFGIDKRRAHLSSLICAGQITRESALNELQKPFVNSSEIRDSILYFCKKMGLTNNEFEIIMSQPRRQHEDFKTYKLRKEKIWDLIHVIRPKRTGN